MQLAYKSFGADVADVAGLDTTFVLLHPVGLSSEFWQGFADRLAEQFRFVAVDTAGHGRSPDSPRPGRMADRVSEIAALIETVVRGPTIVLGLSFGGMIAMQLALARPDLVRALVLGACPPSMPAQGRDVILERGRAAEAGGMATVVEATMERWFSPNAMATPIAERVRQRLLENAPANWAAAWEVVSEHDALPHLGRVGVPTLVVAGEKDASVPLAAKQALADAIPGARLVVVPGAPHMIHLERSDDFIDAVANFSASLEV